VLNIRIILEDMSSLKWDLNKFTQNLFLLVLLTMRDESNPIKLGPRIESEKATVQKMIHIYCEKKHKTAVGHLCVECQTLLNYSNNRLEHCQFQENKPTCRKCTVHCYGPIMREQIKQVMRFSGPRIVLRAPIIWLRHRLHDIESPPE
jgi:hypothetical protein